MKTFTLHQAARESGLTITTLIQGIRRGMLETQQRPTGDGNRLQHWCTKEQLGAFVELYEEKGVFPGGGRGDPAPKARAHTIPKDALLEGVRKRRIEMHQEAKEIGISIGEYMQIIEPEVGYE